MDLGQDIDFLLLLLQQILQLPHFGLQAPHSLLQALRVSPGEGPATELVTRPALEADIGALRTARSDSIAADFLAPTSITSLGYPTLRIRADFDDFHGKYARHRGGRSRYLKVDVCRESARGSMASKQNSCVEVKIGARG